MSNYKFQYYIIHVFINIIKISVEFIIDIINDPSLTKNYFFPKKQRK